MTLVFRPEQAGDVAAIHRLNAAAFKTAAEARLVDALRANSALNLSVVALADDAVIGHIAFSPVTIESEGATFAGVGLGPMAVDPLRQREGIGGRLIRDGLERLRAAGHEICVVLGHADYYPRHGFVRAKPLGICWENPVPDDVFFVQELRPGALDGVTGVVRYRPEFAAV
ncbi:MAG: N-acetyltransferase [Polyangiaceae bacterium]|nr:N-acetyltransferase [Myxococcales bacterium]MCB9586173.1 N-acetyltransferase [Polyangiaceae bacterium]MCB9606850.1 N-acetyltransferase [Polyangiaceae bacterium]